MDTLVKLLLISALCVCALSDDSTKKSETRKYLERRLQHVHTKTSAEVQQKAASEVVARLLPKHRHLFNITINQSLPTNSFQLFKNENDTTLQISASSGVAACKGFHHYFKNVLGGHISWNGNRIPRIPAILPPINYTSQSASEFVYHQNVCTWSYSYAWWTWADWRRHIDWMAMMGVSLTIAPIQEAIWTRVYRKFGLTEDDINSHFSGPAFLAWQRMGNIHGWLGPLSYKYRAQQLTLQKQIIQAERSLGMSVALPAFAGHVPNAFTKLYPNVTITPLKPWSRFPLEYCCTMFVDPAEELFQKIGKEFLQEVIKEYGTNHLYFSDPFNENPPAVLKPEYMAETSLNIYQAMERVDKDAVWLLQDWMFEGNPLWSQDIIKAFLTAIPIGRMLILDLQSEIVPQYERTHSYFGQPFIWCMLHNYGGTSGMHGSLHIVNNRIGLTWNMTNSTMIGVGITMEGLNDNYVLYEFALERGWQLDHFDEKQWYDSFTATRYGLNDPKVRRANDLLRKTVYGYRGPEKLHGKYSIVKRPSLRFPTWIWYKIKDFQSAWYSFLKANPSFYKSPLYRHDLVDITRQFLQIKIDEYYVNIVHEYKAQNLPILRILNRDMLELFIDLEKILRTSPRYLLGNWLTAAKRMATNPLEKQMYEINARNQITLWGPDGQITDYASKQWSGMVEDYYFKRWEMFLNELELALENNQTFDDKSYKAKLFREVENPFTYSKKVYPTTTKGDSIKISVQIYKKWTDHNNKHYLTQRTPIQNKADF